MHSGDRLIKAEDLPVSFRDKSKHDHFKYNRYIQNGRDRKASEISANARGEKEIKRS